MALKKELENLEFKNRAMRDTIANLQLGLFTIFCVFMLLVTILIKTNIEREHHLKDLQSQINDSRDSIRRNIIRIVHLEQEDRVLREKVQWNE
ncbi:hypothetical protein [Streptococcus sp. Marseille-P7376]|uniref:hypothetical protein n=1 Tax=Streptococcus sp. Marseille-P7376 TaxID=2592044 RepID=UPI0011E803AF|nr:hypothetical protein [Streptococcus sp. Marseille-P7376]